MALMQELDAKVNDYMNREWVDAKTFSKRIWDCGPNINFFLRNFMEVLIAFDYMSKRHILPSTPGNDQHNKAVLCRYGSK